LDPYCVNRAQNLSTQLEEVKREDEQLRKITDLIVGQSNLNAAEAAKVEKPTTELLSQRNPTQTVKILDLMQREIKEEREVRYFLFVCQPIGVVVFC
jgi:deoxyhypusine synthase